MHKLSADEYDTDKKQLVHYLKNYDEFFEPLKDKQIKLLELGIYRGGSLLLWRDYFEKGTIVGLDLNPAVVNDSTGRIHTFQGRQEDTGILEQIANQIAPEGFDIIIDDCSHIGEPTRTSFWYLFENHLKSGGIYAIEDWGTCYWKDWVDGHGYQPEPLPENRDGSSYQLKFPSHDYGMVGVLKQLVDEVGMGDITHARGVPPYRPSKIRKMQISHSHAILIKN